MCVESQDTSNGQTYEGLLVGAQITIRNNGTYTSTSTSFGSSGTYVLNENTITAKNNTKTFTLNEGTSATITFSPDNGYRIKSIKVNKSSLTLTAGKTAKLKVSIVKLNKSKKIHKNWHVATLRYLTSDKSIATVNKNGKVKGVAKGSCNVYVLAHNGVHKKVRVTVR